MGGEEIYMTTSQNKCFSVLRLKIILKAQSHVF